MIRYLVQTLEVLWSEQFAQHCILIKGVSALCFALLLHTLPCVMLFSHSPKGCEKRKHGKRCAALSHEISPAHSARVKQSVFCGALPPFFDFLLRSPLLVSENFVSENFKSESLVSENFKWSGSSVNADHHFTSGRKKRIPMPRFVLTMTWVQSYSAEPFARISALQTAYKKVIFLLSKNYKLIINRLRK